MQYFAYSNYIPGALCTLDIQRLQPDTDKPPGLFPYQVLRITDKNLGKTKISRDELFFPRSG